MNQEHALSRRAVLGAAAVAAVSATVHPAAAQNTPGTRGEVSPSTAAAPRVVIDTAATGWRPLTGEDFVNVNCAADTWAWHGNSVHCTGKPLGVTRSVKQYTNFELICRWRHLTHGGNSGVFVWTTPASVEQLAAAGKPGLPRGIEVQVLDLGYKENYEKRGKRADWFTCHGDVFPVGVKLNCFPPLSPDGSRSFPRKRTTLPSPQWNQYYVRAVNGEVRLWVNGEEVSGGNGADPRTGYLCLESEHAPIDFKDLFIRELA